MPPSPALRCSPGREPRADNHKRGNSLESGLLFGEKDDDLMLFNEMQTRERDNFLLQPSDDFEDTFSTKLRYFSDYKLGISIPVRGENSDMLNTEGEKNDYDWLLTPPDTPLFSSLDDEPPPANVARRGRPRSQPISISRSSTMEKSYRGSRGSASPNRLSPSPRSGNSTFQSRGRPSSAYSSPPPSQQHATPSRRSPPPSKPSTPAPRSSTPTPRRVSTGSSGSVPSSGVRGISPVKTSRGNSASPKIRAWQTSIPGFSSDAPPNLRTSLADRPASYVRGSSPASRASRDSTSKHGRQSMSPTASRSVSSSHSHDRDRFSSHSKGSVASSGDDDLDSLQSISIGNSDRSASKRVSAYPNNRSLAFSKQPARILSSSSAPKRSFDSALRQMDNRKGPQNMFRQLLSSVPSTSFYVGKASAAQRSMISRNSSVTTSSIASSDHGTIVAPDTEASDPNQEDVGSEYEKVPDPVVQEEVFAFDKMDAINEEVGLRSLNIRHGDLDRGLTVECGDSDDYSHQGSIMETTATSENIHVKDDFSEVDSLESAAICSKCGCTFREIDPSERDDKLCPECNRKGNLLSVIDTQISENSQVPSTKISEVHKSFDALEPVIAVPRLPEVNDTDEPRVCRDEETVMKGQGPDVGQGRNHLHENSLGRTLVEGGEQVFSNQKEMSQPTVGYCLSDSATGGQQSRDYQNLKVDVSEGAGTSVLLKRSSSSKGFLVQGRTFTDGTVAYNDLSYARDSTNSIRSSTGHGSVSASSSVDFSSARQTETRVQRQLSGKKSDMENCRYDINYKPQGNGTSLFGNSNHSCQALGVATSTHEGNFEVAVGDVEHNVLGKTAVVSQELVLQEVDVTNTAITRASILEEGNFECDGNYRTTDASTSELSSHAASIRLDDNLVASFPNSEDYVSYENGAGSTNNVQSILDMEASSITPESSLEEEHAVSNTSVDGSDMSDVPSHSTLVTRSEIEIEKCMQSTSGSQIGDICPQSKSIMNEFQESSVPTPSEKNLTITVSVPSDSDHRHSISEESTVMLQGQEGGKARSLSLEEATDTILFCSSIVHDLAYEAATIAMEKESSVPLEGSRPTVTIPGKFSSDRKDSRGRTVGKRASKSQKARQRRVETDTNPPFSKPENDENIDHQSETGTRIVGLPKKEDSMKAPPKLESKCNCTIM